MEDAFNLTVTDIAHVHYRISSSQWKISDVSNKFYTIAYAESGEACYILDGKEVRIKPGTLLFFKKNEKHTGWANEKDPWIYFSIGFDLLCLDRETEQKLSTIDTLMVSCDQLRYRNLFLSIYQAWNARIPGYQLETRRRIMELLQEFLCNRQYEQLTEMQLSRINKVIQYIHENMEKTHNVADLAELAGFSESYFSKLFRRMTGHSVNRYQNILRLTYARDLLQSRNYSVAEAASAVGFNDIYYFSRLYKKLMGYPPSSTIKMNL